MKIEKVNDNQIRCTLTKEDLDIRQLKISEIAYGSEKAKSLFRDMMQQANYEYGFEAEDIPLMIEAIPMSSGCIVFIITKVEDPEELDTRFSKFAPSVHEDEDEDDVFSDETDEFPLSPNAIEKYLDNLPETPEDVFDLFRKISGKKAPEKSGAEAQNASPSVASSASKPSMPEQKNNADEKTAPSIRIFSFEHLDILTDVAHIVNGYYSGGSALYKNPVNNRYYLLLARNEYSPKDFIRVCNLLMEYGSPENSSPATIAYMEEHYSTIIANHAVPALAQI